MSISKASASREAGDDEALDRVEAQINAYHDRQARIQERLEILERRLAEAPSTERNNELDRLTEQAQERHATAVKLITIAYPKLASVSPQMSRRNEKGSAFLLSPCFTGWGTRIRTTSLTCGRQYSYLATFFHCPA
jgi:hypothetical protein